MAINELINLVKKIYGLNSLYVLLSKKDFDMDLDKGRIETVKTEDSCNCVNIFTTLEFAQKYLDDMYEEEFEVFPISKIEKQQYNSFFHELTENDIKYINFNCAMNIDSTACEVEWFIKVNKIEKENLNVLDNLYLNTIPINEDTRRRQVEILNQVFDHEYRNKLENEQSINENCFVYHMILSTMIPSAKRNNPEHVFYFNEVLKYLQIVIWNKLKEFDEYYVVTDEDGNVEIMHDNSITVVYTDKVKENTIRLNIHELKELLSESNIKEVYVTDGDAYFGRIKASRIVRDRSIACNKLLEVFPNLNDTIYIIGNKEEEHIYIDDCIRIFNTKKACSDYIKQIEKTDEYDVYKSQLIEILDEMIKECHDRLYVCGFDKTVFSVDFEDLLSIKDFIRSFSIMNDAANGKITDAEAYELLKDERIYLIGDIDTINDYVVKISTMGRETPNGDKYNAIRCFIIKEVAEKYNRYNFTLTHIKLEDLIEMCNGEYSVMLEPHQNCWLEFGTEHLFKNNRPASVHLEYFYPVSEYIFENIELVEKDERMTELITQLREKALNELKKNSDTYLLKNVLLGKYLHDNEFSEYTDYTKKVVSILGEECILNRKLKNKDEHLVLHVDLDDFNLFPNLVLLNLIGIIYFYTDEDRILSVKLHTEKNKLPVINKYKNEINTIMKEIDYLDQIAIVLKNSKTDFEKGADYD